MAIRWPLYAKYPGWEESGMKMVDRGVYTQNLKL